MKHLNASFIFPKIFPNFQIDNNKVNKEIFVFPLELTSSVKNFQQAIN